MAVVEINAKANTISKQGKNKRKKRFDQKDFSPFSMKVLWRPQPESTRKIQTPTAPGRADTEYFMLDIWVNITNKIAIPLQANAVPLLNRAISKLL